MSSFWIACLCFPLVLGDPTWKAGAAKIAITPHQPLWMSGYASRTKPAEGKLHDLWAKALVLEDPHGRRGVQARCSFGLGLLRH